MATGTADMDKLIPGMASVNPGNKESSTGTAPADHAPPQVSLGGAAGSDLCAASETAGGDAAMCPTRSGFDVMT